MDRCFSCHTETGFHLEEEGGLGLFPCCYIGYVNLVLLKYCGSSPFLDVEKESCRIW